MALYVSVCLLAALTAVAEHEGQDQRSVLGLVWGTTLGLALAHWFAFRLATRLASAGRPGRRDAEIAAAQIGGAVVVAVLATVPVVVLSPTAELDFVRLLVAGFIAVVGYQTYRSHGAPKGRSAVAAALVLLLAVVVALAKNVLSGH